MVYGNRFKQGKGREISGRAVTFEDIKPLLDVWVLDADEAFGRLEDTPR